MRLNWFVVITDLTGSADGSVRLWEWEHQQPLTVMRAPGTFPKVTKVLFNQQGNKVTFFSISIETESCIRAKGNQKFPDLDQRKSKIVRPIDHFLWSEN